MTDNLLVVDQIKKYFPIHTGFFGRHTGDVKAVDGVSFALKRGETLGLVGESGCGKSTLGRTIVRIYEPTQGKISFQGRDFHAIRGDELRKARKDIQMIFQDPFASLDPRMTVGQILMEPAKVHGIGSLQERKEAAKDLLSRVGLKSSHINRYPHEFSGGQRQRISVARAIALKPKLVVADEPVSALDVSVQAQILNLMRQLQQDMGLTYLFISHDLSVVDHFCDVIAVMYLGKIVEMAPRKELFGQQLHPYTKALFQAIPKVGIGKRKVKKSLSGEVPSPINPPSGCAFHPRCPLKKPICAEKAPPFKDVQGSNSHQVACWVVH
jgi:oligopeptide transport system ATP-binding protein